MFPTHPSPELIQNLDVSAGDLLSRTHEELVLLLIQLRRQNTTTARTIEQCCTEMHEVQVIIIIFKPNSLTSTVFALFFFYQAPALNELDSY